MKETMPVNNQRTNFMPDAAFEDLYELLPIIIS
jgi:hypothetical protein